MKENGKEVEELHECERCELDFDMLLTRQGFVQTFFVEWVCEGCFLELEGVSFEEFSSENL